MIILNYKPTSKSMIRRSILDFTNSIKHTVKLPEKLSNFPYIDGGLLENYIFILEPHPHSDAILVSADYDGKIIIWNIELGVMLNCFVENCAHLGLPLLEAPILDGRFSPDGLNFCVTTFYGSISLYGYGDRDLYLTTPNQQFFSKEFMEFKVDTETGRVLASESGTDMYMVDKGALCKRRI